MGMMERGFWIFLLNWVLLGIIYVLASCGINSLYHKQANKAGWLGRIGTVMLAGGWLLNVITNLTLLLVLSLELAGQEVPV